MKNATAPTRAAIMNFGARRATRNSPIADAYANAERDAIAIIEARVLDMRNDARRLSKISAEAFYDAYASPEGAAEWHRADADANAAFIAAMECEGALRDAQTRRMIRENSRR